MIFRSGRPSFLSPESGPVHGKKGSWAISGEGLTDFQERILVVPKAVGHSLDDLDGVVDAFRQAGVQLPGTVSQDAWQVWWSSDFRAVQHLNEHGVLTNPR